MIGLLLGVLCLSIGQDVEDEGPPLREGYVLSCYPSFKILDNGARFDVLRITFMKELPGPDYKKKEWFSVDLPIHRPWSQTAVVVQTERGSWESLLTKECPEWLEERGRDPVRFEVRCVRYRYALANWSIAVSAKKLPLVSVWDSGYEVKLIPLNFRRD